MAVGGPVGSGLGLAMIYPTMVETKGGQAGSHGAGTMIYPTMAEQKGGQASRL